MKLRNRLITFFLLLALLPLAAVAVISFIIGRAAIENSTVNHLVSTNIMKQSEMDRWIKNGTNIMRELAQRPLVRKFSSALLTMDPSTEEYLTTRKNLVEDHFMPGQQYGNFLQVFLLNPYSGNITVATDPVMEGQSRQTHQFFQSGKLGTFVEGPYYSITNKELTITIATPVFDMGLAGVLACNLDLRDLSGIIEKNSGLSYTEDTYLVNSENVFVTEPRFGIGYAMKQTVYTEGVLAGLAGKDGVSHYLDYRGVPVLGAYTYLPEYNMCIITEIDQSEAFAPVDRLGWIIIIIALVIGGGVLVLGILSARNITTPIKALVNSARAIGAGNLDSRLNSKAGDEIGDLSREFDSMADKLQQTMISRDKLESLVTERTTQLQLANKELESFSYSVSHDLRAPLRAMTGYSRILIEDYKDRLDSEGQRICDTIVQSAQRMSSLIDDLLELSRTSRADMNFSNVDMDAMARSVFLDLATDGKKERIHFVVEPLESVRGDPALLRHVWTNLLSNAIKFTSKQEDAGINVFSEKKFGEIIYCVKDTGAGFDMTYVDKLFGVFQRLHSSSEFEGNGVGLAIVQRIIQRHGGRVWAAGEVNRGASFCFSIPDRR